MTRVLVTGSRDWTDEQVIEQALRQAWADLGSDPGAVLVHGACHLGGADAIAERAWQSMGLPTEAHPAGFGPDGHVLGPERNARMVALGADVCLAFPLPGSRGTRNCMRLAREAGIPVRVVEPSGDRAGPPLRAGVMSQNRAHWARRIVERDGLAVIAVDSAGQTLPFAYTVGLTEHDHPEVLVIGLPPGTAQAVLNSVARPVVEGRANLAAGRTDAAFGNGVPGWYVADHDLARPFVRVATALYGDRVRVLQLCWPDVAGRFPWDQDSAAKYPLVGSP